MNKELFVSSTPHETRIAISEDGELTEVYIEREEEYTLAGSIHKGRVTRVLPGMQSAFVDLGLERDAFLYVSDFFEDSEEYERVVSEAEEAVAKLKTAGAAPAESSGPAAAPGPGGREAGGRRRRRERGRRGRGGFPDSKFARPDQLQAPGAEGAEGGALSEAREDSDAEADLDGGSSEFEEFGGDVSALEDGAEGERLEAEGFAEEQVSGEEEHAELLDTPPSFTPEPVGETAAMEAAGGEPEPEVGANQARQAGEQESAGGASSRYRDERRGRRHGRDRRHRHGRDGERETPRESAPEPSRPPETSAPAAKVTYPFVLPGESLAKYRGAAPSSEGVPQAGPHSAPAQSASETATGKPERTPDFTLPNGFDEEQPTERAWHNEVLEQHVQPEALEQRAEKNILEQRVESKHTAEPAAPLANESGSASRFESAVEPEQAASPALPELESIEAPAGDEESEQLQAEGDGETLEPEGDGEPDAEGGDAAAEPSAEVRQQPGQARFEARGRRRRRRGGRGGEGRNLNPASGGQQLATAEPPRLVETQVPGRPAEARAEDGDHRQRAPRLIGDLLHAGQEILVQISKEPLGKKGARITSHLALPGRFLVYMPTVHHIGVSRKISSDEERARLKRIILENTRDLPGGFIVRTAGAGGTEEEFKADIRFLSNLWNEIREKFENSRAPKVLYHDLNLVERTLRDQLSAEYTHIWVDSEEQYQRVVRFIGYFMPALASRVRLYTRDEPMFEHFGLQEEINKSLKSKVWLKSGGYIVINQTEALVAIDINTGKYVGKSNRLEDTIVKTNIDAIKEIVRQIRLRDLGGIIVIDFIDMDERKNRQKVMQALEEAMRADKAPSKLLSFNDFGLVALTRKRVKQSLERTLGSPCPYCAGVGLVKSVVTVCNEIHGEIRKMARTINRPDLVLRVNPEIAKALKARNARYLNEMEEVTGKTILIKPDPLVHQEQFEIF